MHRTQFRVLPVAAVLLVLSMLAAACGGGNDTKSSTSTTAKQGPKVGLVFDIGGRGDKSFNDSAVRGLDKATKEFNLQTKELEPSSGGENREELLRLLSDQGYPLVFAIGFAFTDSVVKVAPQYPNLKYGLVDGVPDNPIANVSSLTFAEEQGSFLVGAAAAMKSKVNHIGFIGGVEVPLIQKFQAGYEAGAKAVNPSITIDVKYLTQPPDFGGFRDPAKGKEAALGLFANGADVVYHAAGLSGTGLFDAAVQASTGGKQLWAIGVDSDQYLTATPDQQKHILTSMIKQVEVAVYETAKDFVNNKFQSGVRTFDLKSGGIDYSTSGGYLDDVKTKLDSYKQKIISGEIKVPTEPGK
ncbi:MAG TPA: BMP family ABC transporter substrate-binding protein [Acidimicrobiales bacterium]|nr:BMP family ABC transporter substrate-binding protein [Acidimicrobiales bacterium]